MPYMAGQVEPIVHAPIVALHFLQNCPVSEAG